MGGIDLRIDFKIDRFPRAQIAAALARGLNRGGGEVHRELVRTLKTRTNVRSVRSITSRVRTVAASPGGLEYRITASGKGIPIEEFPVKVTASGVEAMSWGTAHLFKRSFSTTGGALRARLGASRYPIRKLYGPALPKEMASDEVAQAFAKATAQFVVPALVRALGSALG